jgi:DNA-binding LytR/AlgR family response regulator
MQVLVIEDEKLAAERLIELIRKVEPSANIVASIDSVRATVSYLQSHPQPDLIFMDIQLADGLCFDIFKQTTVNTPIIFTTAYDEYALRAFKVNSIDYLLKPIDKKELQTSLYKYRQITPGQVSEKNNQDEVIRRISEMLQNPYKTRFVIKIGEHIKVIDTADIVLFYSNDKSSFLHTSSDRDYAIEYSLDLLEKELDPRSFFRVNRKFIIAMPYIKDIVAYSGSRLKLIVKGAFDNEILVSREKVSEFKKWLEGNSL